MPTTRRDLARLLTALGGAAALSLPSATLVRAQTPAASPVAAGAWPDIDPMSLVDPELRPALEQMLAMMPADMPMTAEMLPMLREQMAYELPLLPAPTVTEELIPGPAGAPEVKVFVINAEAGASRPAILHMHGGGYIFGSAESEVPSVQAEALALDCVVVTVAYRLAPETPFPGSLEDNYAALVWLHANAERLGVDPTRIAVQGGSAGGGHAAMLAIAARDRGEVPVIFQSLIYPMLDDRTASTRQLPPYIGAFVWTRDANVFGWSSLLGVPAGSDEVPAGAVPARVTDLAGLPPAWIGVGTIDLFVDEDVAYAQRLILAGVPTELLVVPGAFHGFQGVVPNARVSQVFVLSMYNALAIAFGQAPLTALPPLPDGM